MANTQVSQVAVSALIGGGDTNSQVSQVAVSLLVENKDPIVSGVLMIAYDF